MNIRYIGKFQKHFDLRIKPHTNLVKKFQERVGIFTKDFDDPILKDHQLRGEKSQLRAFSITGNIRVIYFVKDGDAYFIDIGSHNQVY